MHPLTTSTADFSASLFFLCSVRFLFTSATYVAAKDAALFEMMCKKGKTESGQQGHSGNEFQFSILDEQRGIMNLDKAREIFERTILAMNSECALIEAATREYSSCYVFFYQSKKFIETGDSAEMLMGHGPVLVSREDGRIFETGSAFSVDHFVNAFEACGDPLGKPTEKVKIFAWHPGANKVRATQMVKAKSEIGLSQAKSVIDKALLNEESFFTARTVEYAAQAVVALKESGFDSVQLWNNQF